MVFGPVEGAWDRAKVFAVREDAVLTRRFWILTDEDFTPSIETRLDDIRLRRDPSASGSLLDIYFR